MALMLVAGVLFALIVPGTNAQECALGTAVQYKGNWYCSPVDSISYRNFPGTGHYNRVTHMDVETGACETEKYVYSGSLSPLNEELAIHVRGPTWLKQFAVYVPKSALENGGKKHGVRDLHHHKHGQHQHKHHAKTGLSNGHEEVERAVGDPVTATIDNKVVTWVNRYAVNDNKEVQGDDGHDVGLMVTATINGQIVSWVNQYRGPEATTALQDSGSTAASDLGISQATSVAPAVQRVASILTSNAPVNLAAKTSTMHSAEASVHADNKNLASPDIVAQSSSGLAKSSSKLAQPSNKTLPKTSAPSNSWGRQAYYNAGKAHAEGLVFLNHFGNANALPGFGASLSYASHNGRYGVETPQVLGNELIDDNSEIVILSDRSCHDGKCGYTRPGGLSYHGFGGDHKIFLMEFSMPLTGKTGFNADMPAIWIMNAKIALTSQYGENQNCSCWSTGCGELDVFEVLDTGNTRCKSTLHMAPAGGSSDYFERPVNDTIKAAVVFYGKGEMATIQLIDEIVTFGKVLTPDFIEQFIADLPPPKKQSVFKLVV